MAILRTSFEANRLIIGPAVEFRITPKVALEFDVLFQSADLRGAGASAAIFSPFELAGRHVHTVLPRISYVPIAKAELHAFRRCRLPGWL